MLAAQVSFAVRRLSRPAFSVAGKHVFITGGSTGLGLAIATMCAARGARVTIASRNPANLAKGKAEILAAHPNARVRKATKPKK